MRWWEGEGWILVERDLTFNWRPTGARASSQWGPNRTDLLERGSESMKACNAILLSDSEIRIVSHLHRIRGVTESISELDIELHIFPSNNSAPPSTELSNKVTKLQLQLSLVNSKNLIKR